jgi:hypothetical protein
LWAFTDEFIECLTEDEMKYRNNRLSTEVAHDGVSQAVDEWHEREGILLEQACVERQDLLDKELQHSGLTGNEDEELQELNHAIESMEEDIANLRRDLAAVDSNLTSATKAEAKQRSKRPRVYLDARNWFENRILALLFGISRAAYHGGKLNGVHARKFMAEADRIFAEIRAFFLSYVGKKASDEHVKEFCSSLRRLLNLLDGVFSKLRTPHGKVQESDYVFLENSLAEVDKLWKVLNLPQTPKYHTLISHALIQFKTIGGFGDMLEDE